LKKVLFLILPLSFLFALWWRGFIFISLPASPKGSPPSKVLIPEGASFSEVARILKERGVVRSRWWFELYGRLRGITERVKAGEYFLSASMSPQEIADTLVKGRVVTYKVTIPEGLTAREIASLLKDKGIIEDEQEFVRLAFDREFVRSLGLEGETVEGFLFPDTYFFPHRCPPRLVIQEMVANFRRVYTPEFSERARELGLSDFEVVTLASIIEKETGRSEERPLVSAVFHNRLRKGMPLCSDPTVIYGIEEFDGNLRKEDLQRPSPYNTYLFAGLPPTPISNPGKDSLLAALYPAPVDYLYFVSRNDGTHYFSSNFRDHQRAVTIYQRHRAGSRRGQGQAGRR